jgi:O-antigen ligase
MFNRIGTGRKQTVDHTNQHLKLNDIAFWLFATCVALLPVALGGNRPIPFGIAELLLAGSLVFLGCDKTTFQQLVFPRRIVVAMALMGGVALWAFIQTAPIVPQSWANPLWVDAQKTLGKSLPATIAINPENAVSGLVRLLTYLCVGVLAFVFARDPKRAKRLVQVLWYSGLTISMYGLLQFMIDAKYILWFAKESYLEDLTATFINRNHFAIYAAMTLVCGVGMLMQSWRDTMRNVSPTGKASAIKAWLIKDGVQTLFLLLLVLISIFFSHSRAGLVLAVAGAAATAFFYQIYCKHYRTAVMIIVCAALVLCMTVVFSMQFSERFAVLFSDYSSIHRGIVYDLTWQAIQDNPIFGYGLNNFQSVFRLYQQNMAPEFNHAHSDILESILDLGAPACALLWGAIALFISGLFNGILTRRRDGVFPVLGLSATLMVLFHAGIDFSLQIPGVVFYWVVLMGAGLAQSWSSADRKIMA